MGKKMKLPAWQWRPSCKHPKTLSFRAGDGEVFKTVNSMFFDPIDGGVDTPAESWFTKSSESSAASFSTESDQIQDFDGESLEMVVRGGARSERLFFEPGGDTSSILEDAKAGGGFPFKESVVLAMESNDPYVDFRKSMEEMVETHGVKDWECLEELLGWYLKVNGKTNHGFIIGAFIDLLLALTPIPIPIPTRIASSSHHSTPYSSAVSSFPSSPLCSVSTHDGDNINYNEIEEEENNIVLPN